MSMGGFAAARDIRRQEKAGDTGLDTAKPDRSSANSLLLKNN